MRIHAGSKRFAGSLLGLLLAATAVGAQPTLEVTTPPPRPETPVVRPDLAPTPPAGTSSVVGPYVPYAPFFVGPTVKTRTGEYGLSLWLAPNTLPDRGGGHDASGWAALGLTFTWGGPPYRLPDSLSR